MSFSLAGAGAKLDCRTGLAVLHIEEFPGLRGSVSALGVTAARRPSGYVDRPSCDGGFLGSLALRIGPVMRLAVWRDPLLSPCRGRPSSLGLLALLLLAREPHDALPCACRAPLAPPGVLPTPRAGAAGVLESSLSRSWASSALLCRPRSRHAVVAVATVRVPRGLLLPSRSSRWER